MQVNNDVALQRPPGLAHWVPDSLRALTVPQDASEAPVAAHWVPDPLGIADPPVGSLSHVVASTTPPPPGMQTSFPAPLPLLLDCLTQD